MAKLEGAYEQINVRLGTLEQRFVAGIASVRDEIGSVRAEIGSGIGSVRAEIGSEIGSVRGEIAELRRQMTSQFYWLLTLILGSILIPILRDLAR